MLFIIFPSNVVPVIADVKFWFCRSGLMRAGFLHGVVALCMMGISLYKTWDSTVTFARSHPEIDLHIRKYFIDVPCHPVILSSCLPSEATNKLITMSQASCDRALRGWLGFQVVLQVTQPFPPCSHPILWARTDINTWPVT